MRVLTIHDSTQPDRKSIITLKNFSFLQKGFIPLHLTKKSENFLTKFWEKLRFFELLGRENAGSKCNLNSEYFL